MNTSVEEAIFQKGSTTYYFSSKFFPANIREDVFKLYSFVRVADDYVDSVPSQAKNFLRLRKAWDKAKNNKDFNSDQVETDTIDERVVKNMAYVMRKYDFDMAWIESFLDSMQADLDKKQYNTIDDTLWYIYGSAEVIGLMMSRIMGLAPEAEQAARMQGRAMQFINFLRDIDEDNFLGRCYFPSTELKRFGLDDLTVDTVLDNRDQFNEFMSFQLERYDTWQAQACAGFKFIPARLRVPLQTAVDMYNWTGRTIRQDPMVVFSRKVKPRKRRVLFRATQLMFIDTRQKVIKR